MSRRPRTSPAMLPFLVAAALTGGVAALDELDVAFAATGTGNTDASYASKLRPQSDLTDNCFNFPLDNFDRVNSIKGIYASSPHMLLSTGDGAIDFTLHDVDGNAWNLRDALENGNGKPVVLIWGMYTCPAFQGMGTSPPWEKCGYRDQYDLVEAYADRATFVHLYGPEPHPTYPGTNFDSGKMVDQYWSTWAQHRSYEERLDMARRISSLGHPSQVILPDYFPGNPYSDLVQPVWCSYILGARPAIVIAPDGTVMYQQEWLQTDHIAHELELFWAKAQSTSDARQSTPVEKNDGASAPLKKQVGSGGPRRRAPP